MSTKTRKIPYAIILIVVVIVVLELIGIFYFSSTLVQIANVIIAVFTGGLMIATFMLGDSSERLGDLTNELVTATSRLESATRLVIIPRLVFDGQETEVLKNTTSLETQIISRLQLFRLRNKGLGSAEIVSIDGIRRGQNPNVLIVSHVGDIEPVVYPAEVMNYRVPNVQLGDIIDVICQYKDLEGNMKSPLKFTLTVM